MQHVAGPKFLSGEKLPVVVLAKSDGTIINKIQNNNGFLKVDSSKSWSNRR